MASHQWYNKAKLFKDLIYFILRAFLSFFLYALDCSALYKTGIVHHQTVEKLIQCFRSVVKSVRQDWISCKDVQGKRDLMAESPG